MKTDLLKLLKSCQLFLSLNDSVLKKLLQKFKTVHLDKDKSLFRQGDLADSVYFLVKGKLAVFFKSETNEKFLINEILPGQSLGELSAISTGLRSATAKAVKKSVLLKLSSEEFISLCRDYPAVSMNTMNIALKQSRSSLKMMFDKENFRKNIVILPANKSVNLQMFYEYISIYIKKHSNIAMLSDFGDKKSPDELKKIIADANEKNKKLLYLLKSANSELARICFGFEKIDMIYLVSMGNSTPRISREARARIETNKYKINPELILLYKDQDKPIHTAKWLKLMHFHLHHHVRISLPNDWHRILRFFSGKAIALVLGGGGLRCWAQVGVIMAMRKLNLPIDAIGGVSAGAIVSGYYAMHESYHDTRNSLRMLSEITRKSISIKNLTWPAVSFFNGRDYTKHLKAIFKNTRVENLWIPFFCISTNLSNNKIEISRSGHLWKLIRSSTAVPLIYPPVVIKGKPHFDGGLLNNLPVDIMKKMISGQGKIIAMELTHRTEDTTEYNFPPILPLWVTLFSKLRLIKREYKFPNFVDTFLKSLLAGSAARQEENSKLADVLITPDLSKFRLLSVSRKDENKLIRIGYKETIKKIKKNL
jgi:NTE family protein